MEGEGAEENSEGSGRTEEDLDVESGNLEEKEDE